MVIQHNIPALNAHRLLGVNNANTAKNLEKLSSGYKINRAGDDAAGLAISEKMRGQIRGLGMAEQNAENAISLIQTAEGGMQELHAISQRMREIAVQSTNGTYQDAVDRENLDLEFQQLKEEFDRITDYTNYNGIKLLNGTPYPAAAIAATNTISDLAVGATAVTGGTPAPAALASAETIDITINYKADGTFDSITDNSGITGWTISGAVNTTSGELEITIQDNAGTPNSVVVTVDGDWTTGSNVTNIQSSNLTFDIATDGTVSNVAVATALRQPPVPASETAADLFGWDGTTFTASTAAAMTASAGTTNFDLIFDANGKIDLSASTASLVAALGSKASAASITDDGSGNLVISVTDTTTTLSETVTIAGAAAATSNVDGITSITMALTIDAANTTAASIAYVSTQHTPTAGGAGHPDPNYVPGAQTNILFQVGANGTYDQQVSLKIYDMHATQLGQKTDLSLVTSLADDNYTVFTGWAAQGQTGATFQIADQGNANLALNTQISVHDLHVQDKNAANIAIEVMTTAINEISFRRAELGAVQNRLEYTLNNLGVTKENLTSAESTIRDVDMAKEMTEFTKNNILVQASQAMLAQANALPQGVLNLLR